VETGAGVGAGRLWKKRGGVGWLTVEKRAVRPHRGV